MDLTMLRQICRRGRLEARLRDGSDNAEVQKLYSLLLPPPSSEQALKASKEAIALKKDQPLPDAHYTLILDYINTPTTIWRRYDALPHPPHPKILGRSALSQSSIDLDGRTYSVMNSHLGNSSILFYAPFNRTLKYSGFISSIWSLTLEGQIRTFLLVQLHCDITAGNAARSPYTAIPDILTKVVGTELTGMKGIVEPRHIICHVPLYRRPRGTFGMDQETYVINGALNRGRR